MDNLIDEEILSEDVMIVAEEETIGEGENAKKQLCFKGVFSEADSVNINKRVYPKSVLRAVFEEAISRSKKTGKPIKMIVQDINQKTLVYILYTEITIS